MTGLGVVVLAYGDGPWRAVAAELREQGVPDAAVVVAHNPRDPGEPDLDGDGRRVVRMTSNRGYAPAMNAGIAAARAAGAELVLLLTHDVVLEPGCVAALVAAARRHPETGVLGPRLRWRDGDELHGESFGGWRTRTGATGQHRAPVAIAGAPDLGACDHVDGAVLLARAAALDAAAAMLHPAAGRGPLDERFFLYFEETELCLRVQRAGFRVACVPAALAEQESGTKARPGAMGFLMARNGLEFARLAAGPLAVPARLGGLVRGLPLRRAVDPRVDAPTRRWARAWVAGSLVGAAAFARRRFGAPPSWLPGMGDVRVGSG